MDTFHSFKGYNKFNHAQQHPQQQHEEEAAFRRKSRKRILIITVSTILLIVVIIGAVAGTVIHKRNNHKNSDQQQPQLSSAQSIKAVCSQTQYPESCYSSLSDANKSNTTDPEQLFKLSLQVAFESLSTLSSYQETLMNTADKSNDIEALKVCRTVISDALDNLNDSVSSMEMKSGEKLLSPQKIDDLRTWLSSAVTNQETCVDSLQEMNSTFVEPMKSQMKNSTEYTSNSLAVVTKIVSLLKNLDIPIHRKLLGEMNSEFPEWIKSGDRRLLQEKRPPTPNVTVAKDGSGEVRTINDAIAMVPNKSDERFVIYVKEGVYAENVVLAKSLWNVMVYGDGMNKSIVSGSLNKIDGVPTFATATFGVSGQGFIAMDMGFMNTAGGIKEQAVAMRSGSDFSVFYRCSFDAFQDTLYPHSNRQFYRDCNITGTVDFIFGDSSVVFQNCTIMPRQPLDGQFVTITAQGKKDPNENTGISIQKCVITPLDSLTAPTYLGRPWKNYSTTVIMQSSIGSFLNPLGWTEWVQGVLPPSSIFYGEYQNVGPGSKVDQRVNWTGYEPRLTSAQAARFNVNSFIGGSAWLPQTDVTFDST
ncbi:pectinesterase 3-like [Rutidosis leptorrhynchoides]|uniref:pectinesterase 3-like n=1 Tax=Rutidosis leptorrhynchoides TaxID=125765 RepID=UPI003A999FD9